MKYESLNKIYHKRPNSHDQIYIERYNSSTTRHFNFQIQEYNHRNKFQAFFCYTEDFAILMEEIYQKHEDLLQALDSVPSLVMEQFLLSSIVNEGVRRVTSKGLISDLFMTNSLTKKSRKK